VHLAARGPADDPVLLIDHVEPFLGHDGAEAGPAGLGGATPEATWNHLRPARGPCGDSRSGLPVIVITATIA